MENVFIGYFSVRWLCVCVLFVGYCFWFCFDLLYEVGYVICIWYNVKYFESFRFWKVLDFVFYFFKMIVYVFVDVMYIGSI